LRGIDQDHEIRLSSRRSILRDAGPTERKADISVLYSKKYFMKYNNNIYKNGESNICRTKSMNKKKRDVFVKLTDKSFPLKRSKNVKHPIQRFLNIYKILK